MLTAALFKKKGNLWLEGRGLLLLLVFLAALISLITLGNRAYRFTHYSTTLDAPLNIIATPGQQIFLTITAGTSLNGLWASPAGLGVTLSSPAGFSALSVAPQAVNWSDFLETANASGAVILVDGSFSVPTPDAGVSTVKGQLTGDIIYPNPNLDGSFNDVLLHISLPIIIQLIAPATAFASEQLPLYVSSGAGILFLLVIPLLCRMYDVRRNTGAFPVNVY